MPRITRIGRVAAMTAGLALVAGSTLLLGGTANAASVVQVTPDEFTSAPESPDNFYIWHQGYADAPADAAALTADGLVLTGKSQVLHGFVTGNPAGKTLAEIIGGVGLDSDGQAFFQIAIDAGDPSSPTFTTIRPAVPTDLAGDWVSSKAVGNLAADTPVPIPQLTAAIGLFKILGIGVLTDAGTTATVRTITSYGVTYDFANPVVAAPSITIEPTSFQAAVLQDPAQGFTVDGSGFTPGETLSLSLTLPDGTVVGSADGVNSFQVDENGSFQLPHLTLEGDAPVQLGVYTFTVTTASGTALSATFEVIADPAVVVDAATPVTPALANTGLSTTPLFLSAAGGLLILGLAAFGITAIRRRQNA